MSDAGALNSLLPPARGEPPGLGDAPTPTLTDTGGADATGGVVAAGGVVPSAGGVIAPGGAPAAASDAAVGKGETGGGGGLKGHFCLLRLVSAAGHMLTCQHSCHGSVSSAKSAPVTWGLSNPGLLPSSPAVLCRPTLTAECMESDLLDCASRYVLKGPLLKDMRANQ